MDSSGCGNDLCVVFELSFCTVSHGATPLKYFQMMGGSAPHKYNHSHCTVVTEHI